MTPSNAWRLPASSSPTGSSTTAPWPARRSTPSVSRANWGSGQGASPASPARRSTPRARRLPRLARVSGRLQSPAGVDRPFRNGDRRRRVGRGRRGLGTPPGPGDGNGAISRGDPGGPRRAGHPGGRHLGPTRRTGTGARLLGGPLPAGPGAVSAAARWTTFSKRSWPQRPTVPATTWPHRASISSMASPAPWQLASRASPFRPGRGRRPWLSWSRARALYAGARPVADPVRLAGAPAKFWRRRRGQRRPP